MNTYLLGVDIGTSACKAAIFDASGRVVAQHSAAYSVSYPHPGWAEQHPDAWWQGACSAIRETIESSGIGPEKIAGIGVDGQSWAAVAVDDAGNVLCPTPIWTDTRAQAECDEIAALVSQEACFACSGNPLKPGYSLPKVFWMKNHLPDVYRHAAAILQSNSFIVYRLTGKISQDLSQGYGFSCFDMKTGTWQEDMIRDLGLRRDLFPPIFPCHAIVGRVTPQAAAQTGLLPGTPVAAGGLDAACGTLGAGVVAPGQTQEQGGQAGGMSLCLDTYAADPRLILGFHVAPGKYLLQGGTTGGGGALKWLREQICPAIPFEEMSARAAQAPLGSDGLIFLPYMAGERSPLWNPDACGVFFGLNYAKNQGHLIRAVMEGVAFSLRHNLDVAAQAGAKAGILRATGGSALSPIWTQIKADITGKIIEVPPSETATTLGAALLAGVGTGVYPHVEDAVQKTVRVQKMYAPIPENQARYEKQYQAYLQLMHTLLPLMKPGREIS